MKQLAMLALIVFLPGGCSSRENPIESSSHDSRAPYQLHRPTTIQVISSRVFANIDGSRPSFSCVLELKTNTYTDLLSYAVPVDALNVTIKVDASNSGMVLALLRPEDQGGGGSYISFRYAEISVPSTEVAQRWRRSISECKKHLAENAPSFTN